MNPVKQFTELHNLYEEKKNKSLDEITKQELHLIAKYQRILNILKEE